MKAKAIKFYKKRGWVLPALGWELYNIITLLLQALGMIIAIGIIIILCLIGIITNSKRIKKIADKIFEFIGGNIEVNDE